MKVLMCVPNISEGKDQGLIKRIADEVSGTESVKLMEVSSDRDHNRSVFTYLGAPEKVFKATCKLADLAIAAIDMSGHNGDHPRMGAVDVVPFIPVKNIETAEAVVVAHRFGEYLGDNNVPVYFYEDAAKNPERKNLVMVRKGQYEALEEKMRDPKWAPDVGPAVFNRHSGATAVGVRMPLVALNINLNCSDLAIAETIARGVRYKNGGFRYVRAIGVTLTEQGMVQVSMNLTDYRQTPIHRVMETVRFEAARYGVSIVEGELVGPVPLGALEEVIRFYLQVQKFTADQIIETNFLE